MAGPLTGVKVVELVGIGPGPFAAMLLADMGADVVRVHRAESVERGFDPGGVPVIDRNRRSIGVDLKNPEGVETVLRLVEGADAARRVPPGCHGAARCRARRVPRAQ